MSWLNKLLTATLVASAAAGTTLAAVNWDLDGTIGGSEIWGPYYANYNEVGMVDLGQNDVFDFSSVVSIDAAGNLVTLGSASVDMAPGSIGSFSLDRRLDTADLAFQNVSFGDSMLLSGSAPDSRSQLTADWFAASGFDMAQLGTQLSANNVRNFQFQGSGGLLTLGLNATDLISSGVNVKTKFSLTTIGDNPMPTLNNIALLNITSFNLDNVSPLNFV